MLKHSAEGENATGFVVARSRIEGISKRYVKIRRRSQEEIRAVRSSAEYFNSLSEPGIASKPHPRIVARREQFIPKG